MRAPLSRLANGIYYNPNRKFKTGVQGGATGPRAKYSIDLAAVVHRQVSMSTPTFRRLLDRLYLELKHEGPRWNLYKGDQLLFSGTHPNAKDVVDWIMKIYVPELLHTGTVPPPPPEDPEKSWRRRVRANQKAMRLVKMSKQQAAAKARSKRW